jgi:hypothetical protein
MTEAEWLECTQPDPMLRQLDKKSPRHRRKWHLFNCACCRRIWELLPGPCRAYVEAVERYADRRLKKKDLDPLKDAAEQSMWDAWQRREHVIVAAAQAATTVTNASLNAGWRAASAAAESATGRRSPATHRKERQHQADLVREVLGNPFRPLKLNPGWLAANDNAVRNLATAIDEEGAFDRLPLLGDALEDAGCAEAALLEHCRRPGGHVRGCWALDLVLGKG